MIELDNIPRFVYPQLTEKDRREMSEMIEQMQGVIAGLKNEVKKIVGENGKAGD